MDFVQTVVLGALAGFTIYLGLPAGRVKQVSQKARTFLSMVSAGILFFLLFDILSQLSEPIESTLQQVTAGRASAGEFLLLVGTFVVGFGLGLLGLIAFEQRFMRTDDNGAKPLSPVRLALMIAVGLGLHNFSEGLAIGQSAGSGEVAFAALLIIGFGLHNATEGFGIVAPLAGTQPTWGFLGLAGLIGGGPTFLGTLIGYRFTSTPMSILFLALAAGALIYILGELFNVSRRNGLKSFMGWGLFVGFLFAYFTDLVLVAAGM
jgi:ZIP family zinc transporter